MRTFQIIGGYEVSNLMRHFVANNYSSLNEMLADLDFARNSILQQIAKQQISQEKNEQNKFDMDAFLDKLNKEKEQGNI